MRIKYLKNSVASLSILSGLFCLTGCQDDGVLKGEVGIEEYVPQGTNDVAGSVLIHIIEEGDEDSRALPLSVLRMVDIETRTSTLNSTASNAKTASGVPLPKCRKHSTSHLWSFR